MRRARVLAAALVAALASGCAVGPDYRRPDVPTPADYKELAGWKPAEPRDDIDRGAWWSVFRDPLLDRLEREIDVSSPTLAQAEASLAQARALVRETRSDLFPTLGATTEAQRRGVGTSGSGGRVGTTTSGSTTTTTGANAGNNTFSLGSGGGSSTTVSNTYTLQGQASWDLDLWGRIRRNVESDVAAAQASAADLASARLSAQGQLAADYFQLRALDAQQRLLDDTVTAFRRSLRITQNQYDAGIVARSDVVTALTQVQTTQAQAIAVGVQRARLEHAIAVLTGKAPAELAIPPGALATRVPIVPASLPSTLLERRPDIAAAERQMAQQNALIGAAVAAYYPDISLSALLSFSGHPLSDLISTSNRVWSLAASATQDLFEGGLRGAQVEATRAAYAGSVASYRQTILAGFQEVEDQLSTLRILERQAAAQDAAVRSAQEAVRLALNEYRAGTVAFTTVITAQATLLSDQQTALAIRRDRLVASAALIQALGGGWSAAADLPRRP